MNYNVVSTSTITIKIGNIDFLTPIYSIDVPVEIGSYTGSLTTYTGEQSAFFSPPLTETIVDDKPNGFYSFNTSPTGTVSLFYNNNSVYVYTYPTMVREPIGMALCPIVKGTNGVYALAMVNDFGFIPYVGYSNIDSITQEPTTTTPGKLRGIEKNFNTFTVREVDINAITYFINNSPPDPGEGGDPFDPGGDSGEGGGGGDFNNDSDFIGIPGVPDYSITNTGFMSLFAPTSAQLKSLSSYMWDTLNLENWRKIFADPMDAILGLTLVPVSPDRGGLSPVKVGNISTGIEMYTLSNQIKTVDCGSINVSEYWGAYLDFDPLTKIEIFLPFIGFRPLKSDDVMGKTVHVVYYIDLLSGSCVAFVECGGDLLYTFPGSMGYQIPITSNNWSNFLASTVSIAGSAISTVATGGASAPLTVPTMATSAVNMFKQNVDRSGTVAGNAGFLSQNCVYMAVTRPKQALPKDQNTYTGYPSLMTVKLSDLSGYTVVRNIHLEGVTATDNEIAEIESLLKEGVII